MDEDEFHEHSTHPSALERVIDGVLEASVVGSFTSVGYEARKRLFSWAAATHPDPAVEGARTVLVTGANSGLGLAAAKMLAKQGCNLRLLVRSDDKGERTRKEIQNVAPESDVWWGVADLADLDSVRAFAAKLIDHDDHLDGILHNAGAMFAERELTDDGFEKTTSVHVVGPFLLTHLLLDLLRASHDARVVTMTSGGMYTQKLSVANLQSPVDYKPATAYARCKRAQVVLSRLWSERIDRTDICFNSVHPGWADTPGIQDSLPGFSKIIGPLLRSPEQGADTAVWLLTATGVAGRTGQLWLDRRPRSEHRMPSTRVSAAVEEHLWDWVVDAADINDD